MRKIVIVLLAGLLSLAAFAQRPDWSGQSYNVQRAMESIDGGDFAAAKESLLKEISENDKNGYAYLLLAMIDSRDDNYGEALTSVDKAIRNLPKRDKQTRAIAYYKRAGIYYSIDDYDRALEDFGKAISLDGENEDCYSERAQIYYERKQYALAEKDYKSMLKLDPNSAMAQMGIGRNRMATADYADAIKCFDRVTTLYPDYSSAYSFRAEARIQTRKYADAANDIVKALGIDRDDKAFSLMKELADSSFVVMSSKLKGILVTEPNNDFWPYCLGVICESTRRYAQAVEYYLSSAKLAPDDMTYARISNCYGELGKWKQATEYIDKAIELDPDYYGYMLSKANIFYESGDIKSAIAVLDGFIESYPDVHIGYYIRGWYKDNLRDLDGAIADYTTSIEFTPEYPYAYMSRGKMYLLKGEADLAMKDFNETLRLDTLAVSGSAREYALFYLGRADEAKQWMQEVINSAPDDEGVYYEAACLYALMGDVDASIAYLERSLEKGNMELHHIQTDDDLDNIRDDERYKELMSRYSVAQGLDSDEQESEAEYVERVSEVPFTRTGGVTSVKCEINGLPLHFVLDTGAAEVSMSRIEATFMFKNGYLMPSDVIGKARYMDANGDIAVGTVINLRKVTFAGLELENVRASVVDSNNAPLLLGQSVLARLGKVEIDYEKGVLRITGKERVE